MAGQPWRKSITISYQCSRRHICSTECKPVKNITTSHMKEKTEGDQRKRKSTFEGKDSREKERESRSFNTRHGPSGRTIFYYGIYSSRGLSSNDEGFIRAEVGSLINGRRDKPHRFPDRYRRREAVSWSLLPLIFAHNFAMSIFFLKLCHIQIYLSKLWKIYIIVLTPKEITDQ